MSIEYPILSKGEMVRATLDDRKTQTRRVMTPQPHNGASVWEVWECQGSPKTWGACGVGPGATSEDHTGLWMPSAACVGLLDRPLRCPYGVPGDRLWIRECFAYGGGTNGTPIVYRADWPGIKRPCDSGEPYGGGFPDEKWSPSIHMPRWASRITLDVLDVRVQRVQEITPADAIAEGLTEYFWPPDLPEEVQKRVKGKRYFEHVIKKRSREASVWDSPILAFRELWNDINAKPKPIGPRSPFLLDVLGNDGAALLDDLPKILGYVSFPWDGERERRVHRGLPWLILPNPFVWAITFKQTEASA